jgi:hypothetical protein
MDFSCELKASSILRLTLKKWTPSRQPHRLLLTPMAVAPYMSNRTVSHFWRCCNTVSGEQIAGVSAGAGEAIGGYQRGAAQARSGVDQNYQPELGANRQLNVSQVDAAGQIRSTAIGAAKLREAAAVIAAVGREIWREVGQGMRIRF